MSMIGTADAEPRGQLIRFSGLSRKSDTDCTSSAPGDLALPVDDHFRHNRQPELASDRGFGVGNEFGPICGYVQDLASVTSNVARSRDPRGMLPRSAH
jgi:hypothetical protein